MLKKATAAIIAVIFVVMALVVFMPQHSTYATEGVDNSILEPTPEQFIEFRAVKFEDVNGAKQLTVDVIAHKLDFKGFDIRLQYDTTRINTSNIQTNQIMDIEKASTNFEFANDFDKFMDIGQSKSENGELRLVIAFVGDDEITGTNSYFVTDSSKGDYAHVEDEAKIGSFSFSVAENVEIAEDELKLKTATTTPQTGIKVNIDRQYKYQASSLFKFTLALSSKNASLDKINLSTGSTEDDTYKEYNVTPAVDEEKLDYTLELLEYIDKMDLNLVKQDQNATVQIKKPKLDENGELEYDTNDELVYETIDRTEKETNITEGITLNKLGKGDTVLEITVTAEDGKTTKKYTVTIHRPYGTIKGEIYVSPTNYKSEHIATIRIYKQEEADAVIDWSTIVPGKLDTLHDDLLTVNSLDQQTETNGTYEIYVIPGTYHIMVDKPGYLDHIFKSKQVNEGDTIELGKRNLYAGDVNKDGCIQLKDYSLVLNNFGLKDTDQKYDIKLDFNEDKEVQLKDYSLVLNNFSKNRVIE